VYSLYGRTSNGCVRAWARLVKPEEESVLMETDEKIDHLFNPLGSTHLDSRKSVTPS